MGVRIPLANSEFLRRVIADGRPFYGRCSDPVIKEYLFNAIGAPSNETILLLPMRIRAKTLSLTYGDFGHCEPSIIPVEFLSILSSQAELVLDNALCRKRLEKATS